MARRILIVGDDLNTTEIVVHCLKALGCAVDTTTDGTEVRARLDRQTYAGIILLLTIPAARWGTSLQQLRRSGITIPIIAIATDAIDDEQTHEGADAVLRMPCQGRALRRICQRLISRTTEELIHDHLGGEHRGMKS